LCSELSKLHLEIVPQGMLKTILVESVLWDKLLMAQANDEGIKTIK
jgi:hypothetical protein